MDRLLRTRAIAAVNQPTIGTFSAPTLSDVMIVGDFKFQPIDATFVKRNPIRGFLGSADSVMVAKKSTATIPMELSGSGVAGTPPQHGKMLRACAMSETILGTAHTGTAQAGSTTNSIKLAAGASATDDAYQGMLISTTGGTGPGQERVIVDYDATTKIATVNEVWDVTPDATTTYNIPKQVAYNPVSNGFEQVSIGYEDNGILHKARDVRGTANIKLVVGQVPEIDFTVIGLIEGRVAGGLTGGTKPSIPAPEAVLTGNTGLIRVHGAAFPFKEFSTSLGVEVAHAMLVGKEKVAVKDRAVVGRVVFDATAAEELTLLTDVEAGTLGPIWLTHGNGAGNRHVFNLRNAQLTNPGEEDLEGQKLVAYDLVVPPSAIGNDEISYAQV
jgi:hypothetical protein